VLGDEPDGVNREGAEGGKVSGHWAKVLAVRKLYLPYM